MKIISPFLRNDRGFTIIELSIVCAIFIALLSFSLVSLFSFKKSSGLQASYDEFVQVLKIAENNAVQSDSRYGVYINLTDAPGSYTLFKGDNYEERDESFDKIYSLSSTTLFYDVSLENQLTEDYYQVIFEKITGKTLQSGSIGIMVKNQPDATSVVYIFENGSIGHVPMGEVIDTRATDARHVHVAYNRAIDTETENLVLNFNNSEKVQTIPFLNNMSDGQLYWSGTINVGGIDQVLVIQTHQLSDSLAQFSIHRDGRYNNKSVKISLSGDSSGTIAEYSADGKATSYTSSYVSALVWQ